MKLPSYNQHFKKKKQGWVWSGHANEKPRCITCAHYDGRIHRMFCEKGEFITQPSDTCLAHEPKDEVD